jgi:nucleoporin p58/p45
MAKPQGSIFGNAQPTTSGFGNQSQTQPQAQGSSLFGGGAFGQTQNQQPNPPASTGIFGQPAGQQQNQPASTGLFGQPPAGTQQQQPVQNTFGSSLFGGSVNQSSQPQQQSTFGSFGATANQQQQPGQSTFGGWGGGTGGTNPLQAQATLPAGSNTFNVGGSTNPGAGASLFGQPPRQQSYVVSLAISFYLMLFDPILAMGWFLYALLYTLFSQWSQNVDYTIIRTTTFHQIDEVQ